MQPWHAGNMETRTLGGDAEFVPALPMAGAHQNDVARPDGYPAVLFPSIEILGENSRSRFEIIHAFQQRDVDQDGAAEYTRLEVDDGVLFSPIGGDGLVGIAIIHFAFVKLVAERIEMRVGQAMIGNLDAASVPALIPIGSGDVMLIRTAVVRGFCLGSIAGEGHRYPLLDQLCSCLPDLGCDVIQRPHLVIGSPLAPVGQLGHQSIHISLGPCFLSGCDGAKKE